MGVASFSFLLCVYCILGGCLFNDLLLVINGVPFRVIAPVALYPVGKAWIGLLNIDAFASMRNEDRHLNAPDQVLGCSKVVVAGLVGSHRGHVITLHVNLFLVHGVLQEEVIIL